MPSDHLQFGLFEDDARGPLWRASFGDLTEAKRHARELAKDEGKEFFVYSFISYREVARIRPSISEQLQDGSVYEAG